MITSPTIGMSNGVRLGPGLWRWVTRSSQITSRIRINARLVFPNTVPRGKGSAIISTPSPAIMPTRHASPDTTRPISTGSTRLLGWTYCCPSTTPLITTRRPPSSRPGSPARAGFRRFAMDSKGGMRGRESQGWGRGGG